MNESSLLTRSNAASCIAFGSRARWDPLIPSPSPPKGRKEKIGDSVLITLTVFLALTARMIAAPGSSSISQGSGAPDGGVRMAAVCLRSHVMLSSATMTLADLLPGSAPVALHRDALKIALGSAPQPSMTRVLYRQQLEFLMRDHLELLRQLKIPEEIRVSRAHRILSKEEVIGAIESALGGVGAGALTGLDLRDAHFSTLVYVTAADPGLKVIRIESDPLRDQTQFRLWTSREPSNLPFDVSVPGAVKLPTLVSRRPLAPGEIVSANDFAIVMKTQSQMAAGQRPDASELAGLETRAPLRAGQPVTRTEFGMAVLVRPEALASLIVQGNHFSIKTVVTPLEQGVLGQEIKVRNTETRQVIEAKVIGRDRLLKAR